MQAPASPAPERIPLLGEESAGRALTIHFDSFIQGLLALPEPSGEDLARLRCGADLLLGLMNGGEEFGAAAPRAQATADFAEQVIALTDDAFEQARRILDDDPYYRDLDDAPRQDTAPLLRLLEHLHDAGTFEEISGRLLAAVSAEDPSVAGGLL